VLCCSRSALGNENGTIGFELPIRCGGFKTTDCYSVDHAIFVILIYLVTAPVAEVERAMDV